MTKCRVNFEKNRSIFFVLHGPCLFIRRQILYSVFRAYPAVLFCLSQDIHQKGLHDKSRKVHQVLGRNYGGRNWQNFRSWSLIGQKLAISVHSTSFKTIFRPNLCRYFPQDFHFSIFFFCLFSVNLLNLFSVPTLHCAILCFRINNPFQDFKKSTIVYRPFASGNCEEWEQGVFLSFY